MELIEARKKERYTQQQVADYLGISRITYAKMEKNPGDITLDDARKLATLFKVDVRDFFSLQAIVCRVRKETQRCPSTWTRR